MDPRQKLLIAASALAFGTGGLTFAPAAAQAQEVAAEACGPGSVPGLSAEECACALALQAGTIDALEAFLRQYPPSEDGEVNACSALALEALNQFAPDNSDGAEPPGAPGGIPY